MRPLIAILLGPIVWAATRLTSVSTPELDVAARRQQSFVPLGLKARLWATRLGRRWPLALELGGLAMWAAWVGRSYLDFDPLTWPAGGEFAMAVQGHIVWTWLGRCGDCVLWNGSIMGGAPALVDLHGASAHPLVILTTLLWGTFTGAKVTVVICLFLAGVAQWWLAHILELGRFARMWSAAMAVVAGHLAGRMELGLVSLVLSTVFASLAMVAGIALARNGGRGATVSFAAMLALLITAGQGYMQIGFLIAVMPALGILLVDGRLRPRPAWRALAAASFLALLLSAYFLVPVLHFYPSFSKDGDPSFVSVQEPGYVPLNLVIDDTDFYRNESLGKLPYPYLYTSYVGWVPVLLALAALRLAPPSHNQLLLCLLVAIGLIFLAASGLPFQLLQPIAPNLMSTVRHPPLIAGLAVPLVLGLAAIGLDRLLRVDWLQLVLMLSGATGFTLRLAWLVALPALWAIVPAYQFSHQWLYTNSLSAGDREATSFLKGQGAQWVQAPFGEGYWTVELLSAGARLALVPRPWRWDGFESPPVMRELTRNTDAAGVYEGQINGVFAVSYPDTHYAAVRHAAGVTPCAATALGGHIDLTCDAPAAGTLLVYEHNGPGWQATVNGQAARLGAGQWLELPAAPGRSEYRFRYRPWDATLGVLLTLIGLTVALWHTLGREPPRTGARAQGMPDFPAGTDVAPT